MASNTGDFLLLKCSQSCGHFASRRDPFHKRPPVTCRWGIWFVFFRNLPKKTVIQKSSPVGGMKHSETIFIFICRLCCRFLHVFFGISILELCRCHHYIDPLISYRGCGSSLAVHVASMYLKTGDVLCF